jgi:hypothetical protein
MFFVLISFSSCVSVQPLLIEVKKPADVTLPVDIAKVLIVNNAAPQPNNSGITQEYNGIQSKEFPIQWDSVGQNLTFDLTRQLSRTRFFNEVSLSKTSLRNDGEWLKIEPVPQEIKEEILDTLSFDAILSLDRILFSLEEKVKKTGKEQSDYASHFVDLRVHGKADGNMYIYNKEEPVYTFSVSDSLHIKDTFYEDSVSVTQNIPESSINELMIILAQKIVQRIVPSWVTQERFLYTGHDARLREAYSYVKNKNWEQAQKILLTEYDKSNSFSDKGKLANNIAVCCEMSDDVNSALLWAAIAQENFTKEKNTDSREKRRIDNYVKELNQRLKDLFLLNEQENPD